MYDEKAMHDNYGMSANDMERICLGGGEQVNIVSIGIFKLDSVSGEYACRSDGEIVDIERYIL